MPFASFIGVNQYNHSILLGCALLTSEDIKTYDFVFRTWLMALGKIHPAAILIDQCESIKVAIREVLPNTVHRYCICHIFTKLPVKLKGVTNYKPAKARFKAIIFDNITIGEFEDKWQEFIEEYKLGRQIWFKNLYSERSKWVSVFLKHFFWVGMMSKQRCESMHAFFDGYISGRSSLKQFVEQFEFAVRFKYEKELESQISKRKQLIQPTIAFDCDMQIYGHYTRAIYDFFRVHVVRLPYCEIKRHVDFNTVEGVEVYNMTNCSI
ncbi:protein FAR-RED IMPAIRED RESPONSE 1-like [Capsicum galapagoense]